MSRLALVVSRKSVAAVLLGGRVVRWSAVREYAGLADLSQAIADVLKGRPGRARHCRVGLETDLCPVKLLRGLPPVSGARLRRLIRLQASRWFLLTKPITADAVWYEKRHVALAAAAEESVVNAVIHAVERAGLVVDAISPVIPSLARLLPDGVHRRYAGTILETLELSEARLTSIRRAPILTAEDEAVGTQPEWAGAAALASRAGPLELVPPALGRQRRTQRVRQAVFAGAAVAALSLSAGAVYLWRLAQDSREASTRLAELQPELDRTLALERDARLASAAVAIIAEAERSRSQDLFLIETLTRALPDSAYLSSLARDRGRVVRVAGAGPPTVRIGRLLEGVPGFAGVSVQAPASWAPAPGSAQRFSATFAWRPGDSKGE